MSDIKEETEHIVQEVLKIEKESMQKKFEINGKEKFSTKRADVDVVNKILTLLGEGKKGFK